MDKLQAMFELQWDYLTRYGLNNSSTKDSVLAAIVELVEVLNETPWKSWKKHQKEPVKAKIAEELADVMHFVIEIAIESDINFDEFFTAFVDKNAINRVRQETGY